MISHFTTLYNSPFGRFELFSYCCFLLSMFLMTLSIIYFIIFPTTSLVASMIFHPAIFMFLFFCAGLVQVFKVVKRVIVLNRGILIDMKYGHIPLTDEGNFEVKTPFSNSIIPVNHPCEDIIEESDQYYEDLSNQGSGGYDELSVREDIPEVDTTRYMRSKNFWFILKCQLSNYKELIQSSAGGFMFFLSLQFKTRGQISKSVRFVRSELVYKQQDYRPDINSNGPLLHKEALVNVYKVISYRLDFYKINLCGQEISTPIKVLRTKFDKLRVSQTLVQECSGTRTISRHKTEDEAKLAIKSIVQNSTTVNIDKGEISNLHFIQDDSMDFMMYLYHYQNDRRWNGGLDFQ